jgi:thiol oxidase
MFHVMTVNQVRLGKNDDNSFKETFDVTEVIDGIRLFVENFFGCKECSKNFVKETKDRAKHLHKENDAILYLWTVHNKVNTRLNKEAPTFQDPQHPKIIFPSRTQCPKCYLNTIKKEPIVWDTTEIVAFLFKFYSIENIVSNYRKEDFEKSVKRNPDFHAENLFQSPDIPKPQAGRFAFLSTVIFILIAFTIFYLVYYYFYLEKGKFKSKKHIV